ncbi:MAG: hypothetical protein ACLTXM_18685 [Enterococcus sp.]
MTKKKYLIACLDQTDRQLEMDRIFQLLTVDFFPRAKFVFDGQRTSISNGSLEFLFRIPNEIHHMNPSCSFAGVGQSSTFRAYASFDTKTGYSYFEKKQGGKGRHGILRKLSVPY